MEQYIELFIDEMQEHLEKFNSGLLKIENNQSDIDVINELFRLAHTMKGMAACMSFEKMSELTHKMEDALDEIRSGKVNIDTSLINILFNGSDFLEGSLDSVRKTGKESEDGIDTIIKNLKRTIAGEYISAQASSASDSLEQASKKGSGPNAQSGVGVMRVSGEDMETLTNMIGELHILQSQVELELREYIDFNKPVWNKINRISKIINQAQNLSTNMQMITLHSTFNKLSRVVRNTILELNKNVKVETEGIDTEIDRTSVENLADILMHLVKNAIAHGIEEEEERIKKGKQPEGLVKIIAYNKRESVYIEVHDDGRGIDTEKVYAKASSKNLIDSSMQYTEEDINNFIFLPGFSTADTVDNISGRGVGTDVVRTELSKIGGSISVKSKKDEGSVFSLKIPINMLAIKGTIISISGETYIIPTLYIKEIKRFSEKYWVKVKGKQSMIEYRDQVISYIPIHSFLGSNGNDLSDDLMLVVEYEQTYKALFIEKVIGSSEVIIKPLGKTFRHLKIFSGMSILNNGKAALILDIEGLFKSN
jgi:two-component system chemotaxis sensor kinase CheA